MKALFFTIQLITSLFAGEASFDLKKAQKLLMLPEKKLHGPNCWNSSLYAKGLSHHVRFSSAEEFNHIMESPYCKEVPIEKVSYGTIQIFRADLEKLKGHQSEVHANIWLNKNEAFNKMTAFSTSQHLIQSHGEVAEKYNILPDSKRFSVYNDDEKIFKTLRCNNPICRNKITFKSCKDLKSIEAEILDPAIKHLYQSILKVEEIVSKELFNNHTFENDFVLNNLNELEKNLKLLKKVKTKNSIEDWQKKYLKVLIISLEEQLTMNQPFWLED